MTFKELATQILAMPEDAQESDATVVLLHTEEVIPVHKFAPNWDHPDNTAYATTDLQIVDGVLDYDHPFLTIDF